MKEVQQLTGDKLDEVQRQMQDYDERLKKLEGIMNDKYLPSQLEFQEFGKSLWKLQ